ncbi:hypothetical protein CsSME_00007620 [Camellia sinensis var. sinensis]
MGLGTPSMHGTTYHMIIPPISHNKTSHEVRVRFAGFRYEEDEWVNVKRGIRERSIPLEPSECHQVKVGDLVLCFRENEDLAIYCDAYIVQIQRRVHDATGCKCIFVVRYDYDDAEVNP